jgi:hypothetical protein
MPLIGPANGEKKKRPLDNINNKIVLLSIKANEYDIDKYNYLVSRMVLKKIFYLMENKIIGVHKKTNLAIISRFNYTLKFLETILTKHNIKSTYLESINSNFNNRIILSTIHSTKGLEFDHVIFIDYIPNKCICSEELEEERRLFYVAITRAKSKLHLTYANARYRFGQLQQNEPSRFLEEIDTAFLDKSYAGNASRNNAASSWGQSSAAERMRRGFGSTTDKTPPAAKTTPRTAAN